MSHGRLPPTAGFRRNCTSATDCKVWARRSIVCCSKACVPEYRRDRSCADSSGRFRISRKYLRCSPRGSWARESIMSAMRYWAHFRHDGRESPHAISRLILSSRGSRRTHTASCVQNGMSCPCPALPAESPAYIGRVDSCISGAGQRGVRPPFPLSPREGPGLVHVTHVSCCSALSGLSDRLEFPGA